ncbi:MAG: adenine deaminase [Bacteroidales bacterium]|nr:adenine deaminase [Bacteroidales bacterium]
MTNNRKIKGNIVDVVSKRIFKGTIEISDGKIQSVVEEDNIESHYIIPGLIDAHIHIESSMLIPSEFARIAVTHGTVATVSDPHEIANVLGVPGIEFMIANGNKVPFKFNFGAPSCVPATSFESSGAILDATDVEALLNRNDIKYLSEMMNYPGVLYKDKEVYAKLAAAKRVGKPVDGHAPGLCGEDAQKYINEGISTDHECFTLEEALEKIKYGMKIQIREGSAAKNFEALAPLIKEHSDDIMFCSDDKHPDDLAKGHMNEIVKRAVSLGYDPVEVLRICTYNPVKHYNLDVGLLQENDPADFVIIDNLKDFTILETNINGECVARNGKTLLLPVGESAPNAFKAHEVKPAGIRVGEQAGNIKVMQALDGQLITKSFLAKPKINDGFVVSDTDRDILKIVVLNRYQASKPAIAFIRGFGFKQGAIASTVAHDSHNIIAVGTDDTQIVEAINKIIKSKGGISLVEDDQSLALPLPVAGIMSNDDGYKVGELYEKINGRAKRLGSDLHAPFMTLSFMALLVIPELKLSDKGLFDGSVFQFTSLFEN